MNYSWTPYTYLLTHIPTNTHYYGVRYKKGCHPTDFWTTYFTSSEHVAKLINQYGVDSFAFQIRKLFTNSMDARKWETNVLRRIDAVNRPDFINRTDSDIRFFHDPNFKWYNNGVINTLSVSHPSSDWVLGRLNQKPTTLGRKYYNNGVTQKILVSKPESEWVSGMLPKRKVVYDEVTCPHCGKVGKGSGMTRYHFDNCRVEGLYQMAVPGGQGRYQRLRASCVSCHKETSVNNIKRYHEGKCKL
jgi:hypothetical protein